MRRLSTGILFLLCTFASFSMFSCKAPFDADLAEYTGKQKKLIGTLNNGKMSFTVDNRKTKVHRLDVSITKSGRLGTNGLEIVASDLRISNGKFEVVPGTTRAPTEICFLSAGTPKLFHGVDIRCANFKEACEYSEKSEDKTGAGVFTASDNGGSCTCESGRVQGTGNIVSRSDFVGMSKPGALCKDVAKKKSNITPQLQKVFDDTCVAMKGQVSTTDGTKRCTCPNVEPFSAGSLNSTNPVKLRKAVQDRCLETATNATKICGEMNTALQAKILAEKATVNPTIGVDRDDMVCTCSANLFRQHLYSVAQITNPDGFKIIREGYIDRCLGAAKSPSGDGPVDESPPNDDVPNDETPPDDGPVDP